MTATTRWFHGAGRMCHTDGDPILFYRKLFVSRGDMDRYLELYLLDLSERPPWNDGAAIQTFEGDHPWHAW